MNKLLIATASAVMLLAPSAFAKGGKAPVQNHHCVKAGSDVAKLTHKQCTQEGGKWAKDAAAPAAKSAPAPTPAPAPAPAPKPAPAKAP